MDREQVIAKLREHETELKASGIARLSLFGSVARGDGHPASDVDLMAEFDRAKRFTLFSLAGVRLQISDILGVPVDLAERGMLKDEVKARAEREAILVFQHEYDKVDLAIIWQTVTDELPALKAAVQRAPIQTQTKGEGPVQG